VGNCYIFLPSFTVGVTCLLKREKQEAWMRQRPSISAWLNRLSKGTGERYLHYIYTYFMWLRVHGGVFKDKSPEELLDLQEKATGRSAYQQLQCIQDWVQQKKARVKTKKLMYAALRSFYEHSHVPLPRDRRFQIKSELPPVTGLLTVDNLKKIILSCNPLYQAIFLTMYTSAMGEEEFTYFNEHCWPEIEPQLSQGKKRLKINLIGRKKRKNVRPFYTFIGRDAVEAMQRYLVERGPIKQGEAIFVNQRLVPVQKMDIQKYFRRHAFMSGVVKRYTPKCPSCNGETRRVTRKFGVHKVFYDCLDCAKRTPASEVNEKFHGIRYGVNVHEMRDVFRSEWELSPAKTVVAEFMLGHGIDVNEYNKIMKLHPEWAETQYALAEPYLNILSEDPRKVSVDNVRELRKRLRQLLEERADMQTKFSELKTMVTELAAALEEHEKATTLREKAKFMGIETDEKKNH